MRYLIIIVMVVQTQQKSCFSTQLDRLQNGSHPEDVLCILDTVLETEMHCRYIIGSYSLVQSGTIATIRLEFEFSVPQNTRQREMHCAESVDQRFVLNDRLDVDFFNYCKQRHHIVVLNKLMERVNNIVLGILGNFLLFLLGLSYVLMCLFGYQGIFLLVRLQSIW